MSRPRARNRRSWTFSAVPRPTAGRASSASTPMRPRSFSPARARSRSSARCVFRSSIIPRWRSAKRPARPRSRSTDRSRRRSIAGWSQSRAGPAASPSAARASRWNGRWRCGVSTKTGRSIIWPRAARSTRGWPTRSAARWPRRMRARRRAPDSSRSWQTSSRRTTPSCAATPTCLPRRRWRR